MLDGQTNMKNSITGRPLQAAFTLIELLVAIAVLAILLTIAVPSLQKIIRDNRVTSQTNELIALINLTRNQAIRESIDINDTREATLQLDATSSGWTGNVSVTDADPAQGCPANVIRCSANTEVDLTTGTETNSLALSFEARGFLDPFAEAAICLKHTRPDDCEGERQHVEIRIRPTGQIETTGLSCTATCPTP